MIRLEDVAKTLSPRFALAPLSLGFADGSTSVLIGPSGCGKSTLLRLIAGLIAPDSGHVVFDGEALQPGNAQALRLRMGYVIQEGGLFPHLSVEANVALAGRYLKRPEAEIRKRLDELCDLVALSPTLLARYPRELSGGQRQRVALMRALMLDPALLLLDEPLGALDPVTRRGLQQELKTIFARLGKTVVMVTHDMGEAAHFAGELILFREGEIVQRGTLDDLLKRPADPYVTEFISAQRSPLDRLGSPA
ncbi:MAG: ATP-binding cassette domain-containing protein [Betaproteobacteria bacterium]|nr:ATP-binding cassette domain-containing protein [Betaproteobacteria bacterium]